MRQRPSESPIPPFTIEEIQKEIEALKRGKAKDRAGINGEMLKDGGATLARAVQKIFNDILHENAPTPENWSKSSITVIFKDGDVRLPSNYRPITIIPLLYKLFSCLLRRRLTPILEKAQCPDQAGFRAGFGVEDHLLAFVLLQEKCDEWGQPLWIATLDFKKAFDSVSHDSIWSALLDQKVPDSYVCLLQRLYEGQKG